MGPIVLSVREVTRSLLGGKPVTWTAFKDHAAGSIALKKPGQRRLFAFLMGQDRAKVSRADKELFAEIIAAWKNDAEDPAEREAAAAIEVSEDSWRLHRIEASGFGGLTLFGGEPFSMWVNGENWCLNGQNGSGKTSLASAIIWALTGKRIREQEGPVDERGDRSIVTSDTGRKLGEWPSFASYPASRTWPIGGGIFEFLAGK